MRHLSDTELLDLAEGAINESAAPHLRSCAACRRQVADLRDAMTAAARVEVPEPSPLFWDHLSARVRLAVSGEDVPARHRPIGVAAIWSAIAAAALVALVVGARSPAKTGPAPVNVQSDARSTAPSSSPGPEDLALSLVAELAENIDDESASELTPVDISAHPGFVEESVSGMSAGEREELGRLLSEAMRRPGI